jgi:hypothetical protein
MYQMLRNIATELADSLEIETIVFPYEKVVMEPQLILTPGGTTLFLRGKGNSAQAHYNNMEDAETFFSFKLELQALGNSEEFVESFYEANEKCDKLFCKRIGMIVVNGKPACSVEFKKRVNNGIYGELLPGTEDGEGVFILSEIWDCTIKYLSYV